MFKETTSFAVKKQKLMEYGFFSLIFVWSLLGEMLSFDLPITISSINIYFGDLVLASILFYTLYAFSKNRLLPLHKESTVYFLLLLILCIAFVNGFQKYGYRAIGEMRIIAPLIWVYVASLFYKKESTDSDYLIKIIHTTIVISAIASLAAYPFNRIFGLGWEDFRGMRYLHTNQTFNLSILVCLYLLKINVSRLKVTQYILLIVCILTLIISKNRAAVAAPAAVFMLINAFQGKVKSIVFTVLLVCLIVVSISIMSTTLSQQTVDAFTGVIDPTSDSTGKWRMAIQGAAFSQALETFWLGQGLGGYFSFVIKGYNWGKVSDIQPHNQFLILFLKSGIFGVLFYILAILSHIYCQLILVRKMLLTKVEKIYSSVLLIIISSQLIYGILYDLYPYIGLFYGLSLVYFKTLKNKYKLKTASHKKLVAQIDSNSLAAGVNP